MNPLRRDTPDSEAVISSGDEGPWPSSSFGSLPPRRDSNVPGLPGNIWTQGPRGSFSGTANAAQAMYGARGTSKGRGVPPSAIVRAVSTPSPANSDGSSPSAFSAMPMQPTPKAVRSMSHSQGQQEAPQKPVPSTMGAQASPLPLGLLTEEVDTESEGEEENGLTHTISNPAALGALQRTSTYPSGYGFNFGPNEGREEEEPYAAPSASKFGRNLEHALTSMTIDGPRRRPQWHTSLGWDNLPNVTESRRHSLADIPTRRGSLAGDDSRGLHDRSSRDWPRMSLYDDGDVHFDSGAGAHNLTPNSSRPIDTADKYGLPAQYHVPVIQLEAHERSQRQEVQRPPLGGAPRKELYIVSFKCARVEVFYLLDNTGLNVQEGDMVVVEADRGQDLGMVQHARIPPDDARALKKKYAEEQYKWLMMFSTNNQSGAVNPNAPGAMSGNGGGAQNGPLPMTPGSANGSLSSKPFQLAGNQGGPMYNKDDLFNLKPKAIKRIANSNEVRMLMDKEGNEAKAKRTCQAKVNMCRLDMEILDAEWQWDFNKIIFYYYADHYINFQGLITELYRIYKTRIWLSAVNPASFSPAATGQMPQGIGPGAMLGNNSYPFGQDPDPHGAVRPYTVGYDTYNPNYPSIPGIQNSFQPGLNTPQAPYSPYQGALSPPESMMPSFGRNAMPAAYDYHPTPNGFDGMTLPHTPGGSGSMYGQPGLTTAGTMSPSGWPANHQSQPNATRRESFARAAGIGRQQNPPAPIGTARPQGNGHASSEMLSSPVNGGPLGYGLSGAGYGGGGGSIASAHRGVVDNMALPRDARTNLTFGSMPFAPSGGRGFAGQFDPFPPGPGGSTEADPTARMRAYLENRGATWGT